MSKAFEIGKSYSPRDKYIFAFEDGFFTCLKSCLEFALERRKIKLLETAEEQQTFFFELLYSLRVILYENDLLGLSKEEIESINKEYEEVLLENYLEYEEEYLKILKEELENATIKIEDEDKSIEDVSDEDMSISDEDTPCCDKEDLCEPDWKKECIELQHELYEAKRTIEGLEYALYNCIPYDDRGPKR